MHRIVEIGHDLPRMEENGGTPTRSQTKASHMFEFQELSLKKITVTTSYNFLQLDEATAVCGCHQLQLWLQQNLKKLGPVWVRLHPKKAKRLDRTGL